MKYPDRYVITGISKERGEKVALYWSEEGGGWWQWGPLGWAYRFEGKSGQDYEDAMLCAPKAGPWFSTPDPETIKVEATPAIVKVY